MTALPWLADPRPRTWGRHTPEVRAEAVRRVEDGVSIATVARDMEIPEATVRRWCVEEHRVLAEQVGPMGLDDRLADAGTALSAALDRVPDLATRQAIERAVVDLVFAARHLGESAHA